MLFPSSIIIVDGSFYTSYVKLMYSMVQKIHNVFDKSKLLLHFIATGIYIQRQYYRINCNPQLQLRLVVTYFKKSKGILANLAVCLFIAFISESKKQWRKSDSLEVDSNDESRFPEINRHVMFYPMPKDEGSSY